jgi:hypothetical protein
MQNYRITMFPPRSARGEQGSSSPMALRATAQLRIIPEDNEEKTEESQY